MGSTKVEIVVLGCGGSGGTPLAGGYWGAADPNEPKNRRTRPSIAIQAQGKTLLIDTSPEVRLQTIAQNIDSVDAIIYTHDHADHTNGFDDVRYLSIKKRIDGNSDYVMPIFATEKTMNLLRERFPYMFRTSDDGLYIPLINPQIIHDDGVLDVFDGLQIPYVSQIHGQGSSLGFKIGSIGYSTDVSDYDSEMLEKLHGIETWIVDCGQYGQADEDLTVHPNLRRVMEWNETVQAKKLYLTHLTPRHDYQTINAETPDYIECAYDGLRLKTVIE